MGRRLKTFWLVTAVYKESQNPSEFTPFSSLPTDQGQPTHFALTAHPAVEKRTVAALLLNHEVLALLVVGRIANGALAGIARVLRV